MQPNTSVSELKGVCGGYYSSITETDYSNRHHKARIELIDWEISILISIVSKGSPFVKDFI